MIFARFKGEGSTLNYQALNLMQIGIISETCVLFFVYLFDKKQRVIFIMKVSTSVQ